jgi:hypothetical protein
MTHNPYESPQSIEESLPIATEVKPFVRTREGLIRAAALCVEGGRIQFAAGLAGIIAVLLGLQRDIQPDFEEHLEKLMVLISFVVTVVLWIWGAIKNYRGYAGLAEYVTNEQQGRLYTWCQIQWWFQCFIVVLLLLTSGFHKPVQDYFVTGLLGIMMLSYLHSVLLQAKALRTWYSRFEMPSAAWGYLAGGSAMVICLGLELLLPFWGWRDIGALHVLLSFLLAVTAWDYSQRYQKVHEALVEERD